MGLPLYVASKVTTTNDGPVFPLFDYLPWELRHLIWEQALPPPIPQVMIYKPTTFPKWDTESNTWDPIDGPPTVPIPPPALLHTTQESRAFALKHVLIRKVKKAPTPSTVPSAYHHIVSRPFNRDTDALFFQPRCFNDFVDMYKSTRPEAARHLVFDHVDFVIRQFLWPPMLTRTWHDFISMADGSCRGLRSITMTRAGRTDSILRREALGEHEVRTYYRALPCMKMSGWDKESCEELAAQFESHHVPGGIPWKVRVGSGSLYSADGEEDKEGFLKVSHVYIQRFTASTMYQG